MTYLYGWPQLASELTEVCVIGEKKRSESRKRATLQTWETPLVDYVSVLGAFEIYNEWVQEGNQLLVQHFAWQSRL